MREEEPASVMLQDVCYPSSVLDLDSLAPEQLRPIRRSEFEQMCELGMFDDERVELLRGVVVRMSPTSPPHDASIQRLNRLFVRAVGDRGWVRVGGAYAASEDSEPLPDLAVVPPGDYDAAHPRETWLVIEVSWSSLRKDRRIKADIYAESGVPEYWIVDLVHGAIEVRTSPCDGTYETVRTYHRGERIRTERLDIEIAVDAVLPPAAAP